MNTQIALRIFCAPFLLLIALIAGLCHAVDLFCALTTRPLNQPLDQFFAEDPPETDL